MESAFNLKSQSGRLTNPDEELGISIKSFNTNNESSRSLSEIQKKSLLIFAVAASTLNENISREYGHNSQEVSENYDRNQYRGNRFEFLLSLFINFGYKICFIPFRLVLVRVEDSSRYEIRKNRIQQIMCAVQQVNGFIVCCLVTCSKTGNIEKNPLVIFDFWSYSVFTGWCLIFANIFWRKQHIILNLVNQQVIECVKNTAGQDDYPWTFAANNSRWPGGRRAYSLDKFIATTYFYGVILEEIFHKSVFYLFPKVYGWQSAAEVYTGRTMYTLLVTNTSKPIPWENISPTMLAVSIWHFIGWQMFGTIKSLIYIFVTFCSLYLYGRIRRGLKIIKYTATPEKWVHPRIQSYPNSEQIWSNFTQTRLSLQQINNLTNLCVLGIYMILVPFLSSRFIMRWDVNFIEYKVLMVLQFAWAMVALVTAAEASKMGAKFLSAVKNASDISSQKLSATCNGRVIQQCSAYYVYENATMAMTGGKFFEISYGFMGMTFSVILTYGLIVLGFLHDSHFKKSTC
ncbi:hypothetical protein Fcan01_01013 [Folsomia candida]|uniref:Gustatory receptor n=1 Tax=Folsomia candida TaxID=158441 RepID=A0A226EZQ6_FOLCA|nr:hypothetical protein Fcan01_01013 [Folsomia candida]